MTVDKMKEEFVEEVEEKWRRKRANVKNADERKEDIEWEVEGVVLACKGSKKRREEFWYGRES